MDDPAFNYVSSATAGIPDFLLTLCPRATAFVVPR